MPDLRVLMLSDGRPGHYNLSEGIAAALARRAPVSIARLVVRRRPLVGNVSAALLGVGLDAARVLRLAYGIDPTALGSADVIISAGGETLAANVAAARLLGASNIFYGSLRAYRPSWFTLSLTSYAEHARTPHPVMALKPSRLDPDTLPPVQPVAGRAPRTAALLIGGDSNEVRFADADWSLLIELLRATYATSRTRWLVSNSRRTPDAVSDRLAALAASPLSPIAELIDVRRQGAGTLAGLLAASDAVLVTADSSSMLSEVVWARRPALALAPRRFVLSRQELAYRRWLEVNGWCASLSLAEASPTRVLERLSTTRVLMSNPLDDLAGLLVAHLPDLSQLSGD